MILAYEANLFEMHGFFSVVIRPHHGYCSRLMPRPTSLYDVYIFDLDGTVYLGEALLPGAAKTITRLRTLGRRVLFLSNNPTRTRQEYAQRLAELGLPASAADIVNSSSVMVDFLQRRMPGARLFVVGESSLQEELRNGGFALSEKATEVDAFIASFDRTFDYRKLQIAFDSIRAGARFFATNADRYCPVPGGGQPDAAAMIAAIEACTGVSVEAVVGKPSRYMADAILALVDLPPDRCLMIGDRLETDVLLALDHGMDAALVLTGATTADELAGSSISPTYVVNSLLELLP